VSVVPLLGLPTGARAVIDANIFVYAFRERSAQCEGLLARCRAQEVFGVTTLEVVNEVCHRLMLAEAVEEGITLPLAPEIRHERHLVTWGISGTWLKYPPR
jgi:predicted nucleic acid-binding protein